MSDNLIDAVAYYRMSDDDQTTSIAQQKNEVREYARLNGYRIIREYVDEGKSASKDQEKRVEFQRLLLDASTKGDFRAVLCWKANRFTREDALDSAFAKQVLRQNRIWLDTVKEGKTDFDTFEGRLTDFVRTEQDHKYSRDLATDSVRGRQDSFERNRCPYGRIPFGYSRRYFFGDTEHIIKRGESFRKPRGWDVEVIINEEEAEIVRFIFKTFAEKDISYGEMLRLLTAKGIPSPEGGSWHLSGLRYILGNKAYLGICAVGEHRNASKKKRGKFAQIKPGQKTGIIPKIIDKAIWDAVQENRKRHEKHVPRGDTYSPIAGVVTCGNCGSIMSREIAKKKAGTYKASNGRTYERRVDTTYLRYKCKSYHRIPGKGCRGWGVSDEELMPRLISILREEVDAELFRRCKRNPTSRSSATSTSASNKRTNCVGRSIRQRRDT